MENREEKINLIAGRIIDEYRKHTDLEWHKIAASKIHSQWFEYYHQQNKSLLDEIERLKGENEMVNFILEIDWLTTIEFCDKYNVPRPVFTGQVESSVNEILRIDAVKHRMFLEKAKQLNRANKPKTN